MSKSGEEEPLPLISVSAASACHIHNTREATGAGGAGGLRAPSGLNCRATGPHHTPHRYLISHYNLRAARFLPLLLPRFVLRIIECIPLAPAPAAMHAERRPDNRPRNYAPPSDGLLAPSSGERRHLCYHQITREELITSLQK